MDLSNVFSKDPFPLPHNNIIVNTKAGHEMLRFMDAFSEYNQIRMNLEDEDKIAIVMSKGIYC